jgi:hypothetical protein
VLSLALWHPDPGPASAQSDPEHAQVSSVPHDTGRGLQAYVVCMFEHVPPSVTGTQTPPPDVVPTQTWPAVQVRGPHAVGPASPCEQTDAPVVGPDAYPLGNPQPEVTIEPSHPHSDSMALHSGVPGLGFSMHCPLAEQLPMAKKQVAPDGHVPPAPHSPTTEPASGGAASWWPPASEWPPVLAGVDPLQPATESHIIQDNA